MMYTQTMTLDKNERIIDAAKIRRLRLDRGVSLTGLADATGISRIAIRKIESGDRQRPRYTTLMSLAEFFGVEPQELLTGGDGPVPGSGPHTRHQDEDPVAQDEQRLLAAYRRLSPRQKRRVQMIILGYLGEANGGQL